MPPIFINGRQLVKRYVGDREFIKAYVGSQQVFSGAGAWSPSSLFASGEQGAWYDPSDLSTMFQDAAGTTPVTADGQPVGLILDKSGRGNHATQANAASRPLYKTDGTYHWLQFDGIGTYLSTAGSIGINSPPLSATLGVSSTAVSDNQAFFSTSRYISGINTSNVKFTTVGILDYYAPTPTLINNTPYVLSEIFDLGFDCTFRINASNEQLVAGSSDSGAGSTSLLIGSHSGGTFLSGKLYSLIIRGAINSVGETANLENYVAGKSGVFF